MGEDLYPHVKDGAEHRLRRLLNDYFREENKGKPLVLIHRKPPKAIVEFAEAHDYNLIIMAARGDHHTELLRGGVTEKVIRLSEVPVFTVNNRFKMGGLRRILVPTDTSTESFSCFPLALELAELYEGQITLLHVPELYGTLADRKSYHLGVPIEESIYRKILKNLYEYLVQEELSGHISINRSEENYTDQIVASRNGVNIIIPLKIVFEKGFSAHYGIEKYAPKNADVIVMTTHGYRGLMHFFMGSTAEMVALHVEMPVVTVKPPRHHMEMAG